MNHNTDRNRSGIRNFVTACSVSLATIGALTIVEKPCHAYQQETDRVDEPAHDVTFARHFVSENVDTFIAAERLSDAFRLVSESVSPSVVRVLSYNMRGMATGSGFVIDSDGYILTNNHVIEPAERLFVEFEAGERVPAHVVGADPLTDLAVLHIEYDDARPLPFVESDQDVDVGDWVIAVGSPMGLEQSVTAGIVSATNRRLGIIQDGNQAGYEAFVQTDAAINRGNSGGPLLNLHGEVIGVNSVILTRHGGSDGLGFAIPASLARYVTNELIAHGRVDRGMLGVGIQDVTPVLAMSYGLEPAQQGVLVTGVRDDSPAARAGLQDEDLIVSVNDTTVANSAMLRDVVARFKPGTSVAVSVIRSGIKKRFDVVLASLNEANEAPVVNVRGPEDDDLGVNFENVRVRRGGPVSAYVEDILPGAAADLSGLEKRDIILEVNGTPIDELAEAQNMRPAQYLMQRLERATSGSVFRFKVGRPASDGALITQLIGFEVP